MVEPEPTVRKSVTSSSLTVATPISASLMEAKPMYAVVPRPTLNTRPSVVTVPPTVMLPESRSSSEMSPPTLRSPSILTF